jgi:hypothetical protein
MKTTYMMNLAIFYIKKKSLSLHFWRMKNLQIHLEFSIKKNYLSFWRYIVSEKTKADCGGGSGLVAFL